MRPSPSESATNFKVGFRKNGNDGTIWEIVANSNGTHRWKRLGKAYFTHDNGGRPFLVYMGKNDAYIYKQPKRENLQDGDEDGDGYPNYYTH